MNTITYTGAAKIEEIVGEFLEYTVVCFYSAGSITFNIPSGSLDIRIALIGGGGGGGRNLGGGGGAGAFLGKYSTVNKLTVTNGSTITISAVGRGGAGGSANNDGNGENGGDTSVIISGVTYTAKGGGGGGRRNTGYPYTGQPGKAGGCGGGGGHSDGVVRPAINFGGATNKNDYSGWDSLGFAGGNGKFGDSEYKSAGGGGGGLLQSGYNGSLSGGGNGGEGINLSGNFGSRFGDDGKFGGGGAGSGGLTTHDPPGTASEGGGNGGHRTNTDRTGPGRDGVNYTGAGGGGGSVNSPTYYNGGNGGHGVVLIEGNFKYRLGLPSPGNPISLSQIRNEFDPDQTSAQIIFNYFYRDSATCFTEDAYTYSSELNIPSDNATPIKFSDFYNSVKGLSIKTSTSETTPAITQSSLISTYGLQLIYNEIRTYNDATTTFNLIGDNLDIKGNNGTTIIKTAGFPFFYYSTKYYLSNTNNNSQIYFSTDGVLSFGQIFKRFNTWTTTDRALLLGLADRFTYEIRSTKLLVGGKNTVGIRFLTVLDNGNTESGVEANKIKMIISLFRSDRNQYIELIMEQEPTIEGTWSQYTGTGTELNGFLRHGPGYPFYSRRRNIVLRSNLNGENWISLGARQLSIPNLTEIS